MILRYNTPRGVKVSTMTCMDQTLASPQPPCVLVFVYHHLDRSVLFGSTSTKQEKRWNRGSRVAHIFLCWFPFIVMAYSSTGLIWWISTPSGPGSPTSARTASGWGPWAMGTMGPGWNTEKAIHCWMGGSSTALRAKTSIVVYIMMNMIKYINTRACLVNISCQQVLEMFSWNL